MTKRFKTQQQTSTICRPASLSKEEDVTESALPRKPHTLKKGTSLRGKSGRRLTRHHTDTEIITALAKARGFVSQAAEMLGMSSRRIYERIQTSEALRRALTVSRGAGSIQEGQPSIALSASL
jgi:DNA-binding NtrC family response regulator